MRDSFVLAITPRAGLGNKLLVWARAAVFATLNNLPLYVSPWEQIRIGPLLRRERDKKIYSSLFYHRHRLAFYLHLIRSRRLKQVINPDLASLDPSDRPSSPTVYLFSWRVDGGDYFKELRPYQQIVKTALLSIVLPHQMRLAERQPTPCIGVHIRRGDFPEINAEAFNQTQFGRTPLSYFVDTILTLRQIAQRELPVSIFSDASPEELTPLLSISNVHYASTQSALADMLTLAKSKVIVFSAGSTFGYWSGFLSDAALIHHRAHFQHPIRLRTDHLFEGVLETITEEEKADLVLMLRGTSCDRSAS
jgi:hypothetical protein